MNNRPTPETDAAASPHIGFYSCATVTANFARRLEIERDEAMEHLEHIKEYGTEEINAAVDLRQKLAQALVERDEARAAFVIATDQMVIAQCKVREANKERDEARDELSKILKNE